MNYPAYKTVNWGDLKTGKVCYRIMTKPDEKADWLFLSIDNNAALYNTKKEAVKHIQTLLYTGKP
jgi:hypothetical protein